MPARLSFLLSLLCHVLAGGGTFMRKIAVAVVGLLSFPVGVAIASCYTGDTQSEIILTSLVVSALCVGDSIGYIIGTELPE